MNDGTKIEIDKKIVNHAIELSRDIVFDRVHTLRALFVRTVTVLLCSAHDKDWDWKEEMQGWDVDDETMAKLTAPTESLFEPQSRAKFLTETVVASHLTWLISPVLSSSLFVWRESVPWAALRCGRCSRETCQYSMSQSHERVETEEVQNGKGLKEALDSIWTQSRSNAVERIHTKRILGNFRGRQTLWNGLYQQVIKSSLTLRPWWIKSEGGKMKKVG